MDETTVAPSGSISLITKIRTCVTVATRQIETLLRKKVNPDLMKIVESVQQAKIDRLKKKRSVEDIEEVDFKREKLEDTEEKIQSNISSDSDTINGDGQ